MTASNAADVLNLVEFATGTALYAMLLTLVLRGGGRGAGEAWHVDRLPLATALLGLVWNLGELAAYGLPRLGLAGDSIGLAAASAALEAATKSAYLERIPVRTRGDVVLLPARQIASIVAEGELLHLTTVSNERYSIAHRLHALEARLDPRRFVRLGRGTLAAVDLIRRVSPMPGGTYEVTLVERADTVGQPTAVARAARDAAAALTGVGCPLLITD